MLTKYYQKLLIVLTVLTLAGCAASGMKEVKESGFLGDYSMLEAGGDVRAALLYIKPATDFTPYDRIMFERVTVWISDSAEYEGIDPALLKELTDYYQNALVNAVKDAYQIVDQPGQGVLRVRVAITGVKPAKPVANTMSSIMPVGWVISGATKVASDANVGTGEAATEIEVLDAATGERLAAMVDRRQGGKMAFRGKWDDTRDVFDVWAERFRQRLDDVRGIK